ncbi:MAG: transpeptidase [Rhodospirillaceae bacterium]|nr:transpeptidase [Rhodospirillaceae bacterium]|tara:strand:- start:17178 stop:17684 length:507 start_codon:yes stop_codon:yes gene_type:complete
MYSNIIEISGKSKSLKWKEFNFPCNIGIGGISSNKIEGDKCTPSGTYPLREIMYRADRVKNLNTTVKKIKINKNFKWCDDPTDRNYNKFLIGPYESSYESIWREDNLYDLLVVIGYNDNPIVPYSGSAIFIHCEAKLKTPTKGCISLKKEQLLQLVETIDDQTQIKIF